MAASPHGSDDDDFATKGELRKVEKSIRHDIASLARMIRTIMDHLGISEPPPPSTPKGGYTAGWPKDD